MSRISVLDRTTAHRASLLGSFGESLAENVLRAAGFTNIQNLNRLKMNFPFGDVCAERNAEKFVISVKIRNRYEAHTGKLNARYKLGRKCYELAARAQAELSATPAFLAISLSSDLYSAYFAPLTVLAGSRGIPMTSVWLSRYECLANEARHGVNTSHLKNTYLLRPNLTNDA